MKKRINFLVILFAILFLVRVLISQEQITILHTNDIHGQYIHKISKKKANRRSYKYGGLSILNAYIKQIGTEVHNNFLLFDAGDFMTGNPICDIEFEGAKGGALIYFFNYIGYDGLTPGNHEFDISVENCQRLINMCQFPVYSANIFKANGDLFTSEPYHIYNKGDLRIGVIGVMSEDLASYLNTEQKQQIHTKPQYEIVESIAKKIDPDTDVIIVLSHSGIESDRRLAARLSSRVDIIIGGHSHTWLKKPNIIKKKLLVHAGSNCRNLGRLDITVAADTIQSYNYKLLYLREKRYKRDEQLDKEINTYAELIDKQYNNVIGELTAYWQRKNSEESSIGNFITDCIREYAQADFAFLNSGGIRKELDRGPIKAIDIKEILPFINPICTFDLTGREVNKIIQANIKAATYHTHGILQVSGIKYRWTQDENGNLSILHATINDEPIIPEKKYKGASVDYVLSNTDKYFGIKNVEFLNTYTPIADIVIESIKKKKAIVPKIEGRIIRKDNIGSHPMND